MYHGLIAPPSLSGALGSAVIRLFGGVVGRSRRKKARRTHQMQVIYGGNNLQRHLWMSYGIISVPWKMLAGERESWTPKVSV